MVVDEIRVVVTPLQTRMNDLLGQSWFDILHPKDVAKVKEQLSSSDLSPRERLIDAKTMLPVKTDVPQGVSRLCPGARRSFFCRMKCKLSTNIKEESANQSAGHRRKKQQATDRKYSVIQCTGYLKAWTPAKLGLEDQEGEGDGDNLSCLVAVGRVQPPICTVAPPNCIDSPNIRTIQFISRHAMDGKFLFVDQRATLVLGFLPQELLGTSMYEYYHHEDISTLAETHKHALLSPSIVKTTPYRLKTKDGSFIRIQSEWKAFRNPWTKDVEYLIAKNSVILSDNRQYENNVNNQSVTGYDFFNQSSGRDIQRLINTHVESSKIGCQIAEEVLESQRRGDSSNGSSPDPIIPDLNLSRNEQLVLNLPSPIECRTPQRDSVIITEHDGTLPAFDLVRINNNVAVKTDQSGSADEDMMEMISSVVMPDSTIQVNTADGNDEAAMAVIMSLLEADAGLGGPVDFSGLPWPLP